MSIAGRLADSLLCVQSILTHLSIRSPVCSPTCPLFHIPFCSPIYPSIHRPSIHHLPIHSSSHPSFHLLIHLSNPSVHHPLIHISLYPSVLLDRSSHPPTKTPTDPSQSSVCIWRTVLRSGDGPLLPDPCLSSLTITDSFTPLDESLAWSGAISFLYSLSH